MGCQAISERKKKISKENAYYLITICDSGLASINNEIKKLIDFCDEEIYKTDIDRVVSKSMEVIVFELTDAIMLGNTQKAMETLADLKTVKENVFTLIYLMLSTFEKNASCKINERCATSGGGIGNRRSVVRCKKIYKQHKRLFGGFACLDGKASCGD